MILKARRGPPETEPNDGEDLHTMVCAGGLAVARSTLTDLVGFHSSAVWIHAPFDWYDHLTKWPQLAVTPSYVTGCPAGGRR